MLGVAAILGPRADPTAHWSTTPIEHVQQVEVAQHQLAAIGARAGGQRHRRSRWRRFLAIRR